MIFSLSKRVAAILRILLTKKIKFLKLKQKNQRQTSPITNDVKHFKQFILHFSSFLFRQKSSKITIFSLIFVHRALKQKFLSCWSRTIDLTFPRPLLFCFSLRSPAPRPSAHEKMHRETRNCSPALI